MPLPPLQEPKRLGVRVLRLSLGLLVAASEAGVCLVPAGIVGTDDVIPPTNKGIRYFQDIRLRFGEPLSAADFDSPLAQAEAAWGAGERSLRLAPRRQGEAV